MNHLRASLLFVVLCSTFTPSSAQVESFYESWRWVQFTTESGLPSNRVRNIVETPGGTIWAITEGGVAWFDDYRWHAVPFDTLRETKAKTASAAVSGWENELLVEVLPQDCYIVEKTGRITRVRPPASVTPHKIGNLIAVDKGIYLLSDAEVAGLYTFDASTNIYESIPMPEAEETRLYTLHRTLVGDVWIYGRLKLSQLFGSSWNRSYRLPSDIMLRDLTQTGNSPLYASARERKGLGIWKFGEDGTSERLEAGRDHLIQSFDVTPNNELLIAYGGGEVDFVKEGRTTHLNPIPTQLTSINNVRYRTNGDLWVCSELGLFLQRRASARWKTWKYSFGDPRNEVMDIFQTRDSTIWVGHLGGIDVHSTDGRVKTIDRVNGKKLGLVTAINQDTNGSVWIGSGSSFPGSYRYDRSGWTHEPMNADYPAVFIHKIRRDRSNRLWFLGLGPGIRYRDFSETYEPGVYLLDRGQFVHRSFGTRNDLNRVYDFLEMPSQTFWFATPGGLLSVQGSSVRNWGGVERTLTGLTPIAYTVGLIDDSLVAWGDRSRGIRAFDSDSTTRIITSGDGLVSDQVWDIKSDPNGRTWIATAHGLAMYQDGSFSSFTSSSGLTSAPLSVVLPTQDKIYVGSREGGVNILDLKEIEKPVRVEFEERGAEDQSTIRWRTYAYWGAQLQSEIENRWKVDDKAWSPWSRVRELSIAPLSFGNHRLTIQAKDLFGGFSREGTTLTFNLPPPPFLRPIIYLPLAVALFIALTSTTAYVRRRRMNARELDQQRTRIAQDLHDEVGSNLGTIALISQRLERQRGISSKHKLELNDISTTSLQTADTLREIIWYVNPRLDTVDLFVENLKEVALKMLRNTPYDFTESGDLRSIRIKPELRRNLFLMFKEALHNIRKHAEATHVQISIVLNKGEFRLVIEDNGIGFDPSLQTRGMGLSHLRQRAQAVGASLQIESQPGKGSSVSIAAKIHVNA